MKREQVEKSLIFVNVIIKIYYNKLYKLSIFNKNNTIYLRFY